MAVVSSRALCPVPFVILFETSGCWLVQRCCWHGLNFGEKIVDEAFLAQQGGISFTRTAFATGQQGAAMRRAESFGVVGKGDFSQ